MQENELPQCPHGRKTEEGSIFCFLSEGYFENEESHQNPNHRAYRAHLDGI